MEPVNVQLAPLMPDGLYDIHGGYNYTPSLWGHTGREERTYSSLHTDTSSNRSENTTRAESKKHSAENTGSSAENAGRSFAYLPDCYSFRILIHRILNCVVISFSKIDKHNFCIIFYVASVFIMLFSFFFN